MPRLTSFTVTDRLAHAWNHELVGFPLPADIPAGAILEVRDERDRPLPHQLAPPTADAPARVCFVVDELPALGTRTYSLNTRDQAPRRARSALKATPARGAVVLTNGLISLRVPAAQTETGAFPAPVLAVRRGRGAWLGEGRLFLSDFLRAAALSSACLEQGPLWLTWRLGYSCKAGERYTVDLKLYRDCPYVEITETSELCRDSRWEFSLRKGLAPDYSWTHPHQVSGDEGRLRPLPFDDAAHRADIGAVQFPVYSGIWVRDDYYYCGLLNKDGSSNDCIAAAGVNGATWDYPYENQIDICFTAKRDAYFRQSIKAGHRRWLLLAVDRNELLNARPIYNTLVHQAIKRYETPLDKVKDYVLNWADGTGLQRPFLVADQEQLQHARRVATDYPPLRDYVAALNLELPGDYTYYHAGTHRIFTPDCRNDPAVGYVVADSAEARRKQALFLKDVVLNGLANRRAAMLDKVGHCDHDCASINIGRGLRPWAALYDFAAAEGAFSEAEHALVRATFAFFCYKIMDPDYWPADHLLFRDDHPRSAHRTHWFPGRQSDWAFYNIDNIPHNFHGDLWSACGCVAMAFPTHPESRKWVNRTLEWWESELTQWVFPEGAWLESTTYTLNSMKDYLIYCRALANSRIRDYFTDPRLQRVFRFYAETLMPHDTRLNAASFPVLGDASYPSGFAYVIGWFAGLAAPGAAEFAGVMQAVWKQTGGYLTEPGRFGLNFCDFLFLNPFLAERPAPPRVTKHYPGLGAMLRHAPDTPADIYMFIKGGIIYSHFHEPEGTFLLWWNGTPLCDEYGVQYGKGTSEMSQHNCVEVRGGAWSCYNKGDITRLLTADAFDFVTVDAPILQAWLRDNDSLWGYRGEMGPTGWHRRHFLLVKPDYLFIYDDLEAAHPTTYHLNVKAKAYQQEGAHVHFDGAGGVDMEFLCLNLDAREIRHSEFDVAVNNVAFVPPPGFYRQRQIHIDGQPNQHFATVLLPHAPGADARVEKDAATGGAIVTLGNQTDRALLFPKARRLAVEGLEYDGMAGVVRTGANGSLTLIQVSGTRIGVPGRLTIDGDGPFTAILTGNDTLALVSDGVGRWLTINGQHTQQIYLPAGRQSQHVAI